MWGKHSVVDLRVVGVGEIHLGIVYRIGFWRDWGCGQIGVVDFSVLGV